MRIILPIKREISKEIAFETLRMSNVCKLVKTVQVISLEINDNLSSLFTGGKIYGFQLGKASEGFFMKIWN